MVLTPVHERVVQTFCRHELRRQSGSPTVSVLFGEPGAALRALTALQAREALVMFETGAASASQLASGWLRRVETGCDLYTCAFAVLAHALHTRCEVLRTEWSGRSARDRRAWLAERSGESQPRHVRAALAWLALSLPPQSSAAPLDAPDPLHELRLICGWLPRRLWPVPCLSPDHARHLGAWLAVAERLPSLPLIAIVDHAAWPAIHGELDEHQCLRAAAGRIVVSEGLEAGVGLREPSADQAALAAYCGVRPELQRWYSHALSEQRGAHEAAARSCDDAARLLHGLLQADERTRDQFSANWSTTPDASVPAVGAELSSEPLRVLVRIEQNQFSRLDPIQRQVRARERTLQLRGYETVRVFAREVVQRGLTLVAELAQLTAVRRSV